MLSFEVDFRDVGDMLRDMIAAFEPNNMREFVEEEVAEVLRDSFDEQFARGGYPDRWEPLAESTIKQKQSHGYPRLNRRGQPPKKTMQNGMFSPSNILIRTGDLRVSWTKKGSPDHICEFKNGVLKIGSSDPKAAYHQSSEPRKPSRKGGKAMLPRRPLVITDEAMDEIMAKTFEYVLKRKR